MERDMTRKEIRLQVLEAKEEVRELLEKRLELSHLEKDQLLQEKRDLEEAVRRMEHGARLEEEKTSKLHLDLEVQQQRAAEMSSDRRDGMPTPTFYPTSTTPVRQEGESTPIPSGRSNLHQHAPD